VDQDVTVNRPAEMPKGASEMTSGTSHYGSCNGTRRPAKSRYPSLALKWEIAARRKNARLPDFDHHRILRGLESNNDF
jgi:hypothetical protein